MYFLAGDSLALCVLRCAYSHKAPRAGVVSMHTEVRTCMLLSVSVHVITNTIHGTEERKSSGDGCTIVFLDFRS